MTTCDQSNAGKPSVAIPGYEVTQLIGEGGMGTVYRARQLSLDRTVAVKVLKSGTHRDAPACRSSASRGCWRRSRLLASLSHPNLVTVFDCGQVDGQCYLVTEYVAAPTLRSLMEPGRPWPVARAAELLDRVARAISYIHGQGVLHLDLKPENILCPPDGGVKITDFGLAVARVDAGVLSELGLAKGTLEYSPPEQRFGLPTDERTDLFALAVLAYELLTGRLPGRAYRPVRGFNRRVPAGVDEVLRRALARNREDRYASVEAFRRDLLQALGWGQRRSWRAAAVVAALALCGAGAVAGYLAHGRTGGSEPIAVGPVTAWLIHDRPEALREFGVGDGSTAPRGLLVRGPTPSEPAAPDLLAWPEPRPVVVVTSAPATGFVHLLTGPAVGRELLGQWADLVRAPGAAPENNFVLSGTFDGPCLAQNNRDDTHAWRVLNDQPLGGGDHVALDDPPDRPGNPALVLTKKNQSEAGREIGCYQWLSRILQLPGTVLVLRYRARAEAGSGGRLTVRVRHPLTIPRDDRSPAAVRLREVSVPFPDMPHPPDSDARCYILQDWVRPTTEWRTYCTAWEWPAYCTESYARNIEVVYAGLGTVWVDDVEVFAWQLAARP